jgi:hypothetical protein
METESPETGRRHSVLPYSKITQNLTRKKISKQQKQNGWKQGRRHSVLPYYS